MPEKRLTLLTAAAVLDVERGRKITDAYVLVEGKCIQAWGAARNRPPLPPDIKVQTFPNQTLMPGLINSHVHLCALSRGRPFYKPQHNHLALLTAVRNMNRERQSGVTTLRDCGDQNGVLFALRTALGQGILDGPGLVLCGPPLTIPNGHAHFLGGVADGPEGIEKAVKARHSSGADFIKLIGTGGGTPGSRPARATYTSNELGVAVETSHALGLPVAVHCRGTPGIARAIAAGVDQVEHACFEQPDGTLAFDPRMADLMAQAGTVVTPTIQLYRDALRYLEEKKDRQTLDPTEQAYLDRLPQVIEVKYQSLRGFIAAGVSVVAGNDAGLPHTEFGCFRQELDAMVTGGMSPIDVISAATIVAAKAMGQADRIGSIQTGKQADLVIVDGDPLNDINALSRVQMVMQAGQVVHHQPREG